MTDYDPKKFVKDKYGNLIPRLPTIKRRRTITAADKLWQYEMRKIKLYGM